MKQGDGLPSGWAIRDILTEAVAYVQLSAVLEHQDRCRGELFGVRANPEASVRRVRDAVFLVREPVARAHEHRAPACDQNRTGQLAFGREFAQVAVDRLLPA